MWLVNRNESNKDLIMIRRSRIQRTGRCLLDNNLSNFTIAEQTYGNQPFSIIPPLSDSDGSFHYECSNSRIATINENIVTIHGAGSCTIVATQEKTQNYVSASISTTLKVNQKINSVMIYGERNSGTNFLKKLIDDNLIDINTPKIDWKHGFPNLNLFDWTQTCFVFVIRDVKSWINSMYYNPFHYKVNQSIQDFIEQPLVPNGDDHAEIIMREPREQQTIFEVRYAKLQNYIDILNTQKVNGIIVNLEDLQTDNGEYFLHKLCKEFYLTRKKEFNPILKHTKNGKSYHNRQYPVILGDISNKINHTLEDFVTSLKNNNYYYHKLQQ